jgi:hypothetical protein
VQYFAPCFQPLAFSLPPFLPGPTRNRSPGHRGEQCLFGRRENGCIPVACRVGGFYPAGARRVSHLPGEPVKACMNPVQAFVVAARWLVLILNTFIVFHAATIGWQRCVRYGVFT